MSGDPLVEIEGISKSFGKRRPARTGDGVKAVDDVSLTIDRDETLALVGESGSGKSTLARIIVGLVEPDAGRIRFDGEDLLESSGEALKRARSRVQMVFQDPYSSLNPRLTVKRAIAEPALVHGLIDKGEEAQFVRQMLERVRLSSGSADKLPRELSGGQRQRVAIGRALAVKPELLIADEAISALDVSVQAQILNLFENLRSELGLTMLFISHQLPVVSHIADRVAVMYLGRIVETGEPETLFARPAHPYTAGLIAAQPGRRRRRRGSRPPMDISQAELVSVGCSYRDRCPLASEICSEVDPQLTERAPGRMAACHHVGVMLETEMVGDRVIAGQAPPDFETAPDPR